MSDGPMIVSRFSRPSGERRPILTLPEMMMYSRSPGSPSAKTVCPRGKSTGCSCLVSAATALGSTPWKIPALARISSTLPLLSSRVVSQARTDHHSPAVGVSMTFDATQNPHVESVEIADWPSRVPVGRPIAYAGAGSNPTPRACRHGRACACRRAGPRRGTRRRRRLPRILGSGGFPRAAGPRSRASASPG